MLLPTLRQRCDDSVTDPRGERPGVEILHPGPLVRLAPNPFTSQAVVRFRVEGSGPVNLVLYDARGQLVRTLVDGTLPAGQHRILRPWTPTSTTACRAASTSCTLRAGGHDTLPKVVLLQYGERHRREDERPRRDVMGVRRGMACRQLRQAARRS